MWRTTRDERALERERAARGDGAPVADEDIAGDDVPAEDGDAELRARRGAAHERDEAVPAAHAPVEAVVVPRLTVLRQSLPSNE